MLLFSVDSYRIRKHVFMLVLLNNLKKKLPILMNTEMTSVFLLFFLVTLFVVTKIPFLIDGTFAFQFDHGKDSLAILEMIVSRSPALIGPWTSIPGLFFGPGWYYLLLPGYLLTSGDPASAVATMIILGAVQILFVRKYFGLTEAILVATVPTFFSIAQSAWNPFPMTFVSFVILAVLKQIEGDKILTSKRTFLLGLSSSLGFHFSTAFAIFYPLLILLSLLQKRVAFKIRHFLFFLASFFIGFIPQVIFEFRHNFIQTNSIISYLSDRTSTSDDFKKLLDIFIISLGEYRLASLPTIYGVSNQVSIIILFVSILGLILGFVSILKMQKKLYLRLDIIMWLLLPIIGFWKLHFNFWYLLAAAPAALILSAQFLKNSPAYFKKILIVFFLLTPITKIIYYYDVDRDELLQSPNMFAAKMQAYDFIQHSGGKDNYSVYYFAPDIYDFAFQYIFFWKAYNGSSLPFEFSYKPGEHSYVKEKGALLVATSQNTEIPTKVFFVVEHPMVNEQLLADWWNQQKYSEIVGEKQMDSDITVYVAMP